MLNQNSILSSNTSGSGSADGDVIGPASSTDNAVVRYNGTTGKLVQNSAVTISDSGRVGIGTASPGYKLTVSEASTDFAALITNSTSSGNGVKINAGDNSGDRVLELNDKDGTSLMQVVATGKVSVGTNAAYGATLGQFNGTNAIIANTAGQFSIGTTDTAAADLGGSLGFTANTTSLAGYPMGSISGRLIATGAGAYRSYMAFATTDAAGSVAERMRLTDTGLGIGTASPTYQLQLSTDSAAKPSTNTWTIASDARIKTETGEYTKGLDAVLALRPVTYRYNGKAGMVDDGEDKISIIAQEAITAFPECVGSYMVKLEEGDEEETEVLNWNGHALTFALVNAVKELTARIAELENS